MKENFYRISHLDVEKSLYHLPQLTLEVTGLCNLKCKYCCYGDFYEGFDSNRYNMSFEKVRLLIDYLVDLWESGRFCLSSDDFYVSFYGGEPLLNMDLIKEVISYSKSKISQCRNVRFSMTTNGILIDKYLDYIVKNDILLLVSLDGDRQGNSFRLTSEGKCMYDRICNNLEILQEKYPLFFQEKVNFNSVLHRKNTVIGIKEYFDKVFGKRTNITELSQDNLKESHKEVFYRDMYREYDSVSGGLNPEEIRNFIKRETGNYIDSYNEFLYSCNNSTIFQTATCIPFGKKLFLTASGKILPCERISHSYELGLVDGEKVCLNIDDIVRKYNELLDSLYKMCSICCRKNICNECVYKIVSSSGRIKCPSFQDSESFSEYRNKIISKLKSNPDLYIKGLVL